MSERLEISESVQSQGIWAMVAIVFMLGFFLTVPGCQARSVESTMTAWLRHQTAIKTVAR